MQAFKPEDFESEIHKVISEKYDRLIWTIAHKISGDFATSSLEDNYADLWLAAFEAIEGFTKQNNYANGPVERWIDTKPFDKYLKTCLWNKKNHKGKNIANKYEIHRDTVPTHLEEVLNVSGPSTFSFSEVCAGMNVTLCDNEKKVVSCVLSNPEKYMTDGGRIKIFPLQNILGWDRAKVGLVIDGIKKKMKREENGSI